ncbi:MAG TPA: HYR domain-containing protein, partial [Ilumatobacteraceae bacterium]|nr:HYR domain-containing protein [Ilumatobacteraceae bacterium]
VAATNEGLYAAGQSLGLTHDNIGGDETKTLLSKFRLDGANDAGPYGSTWVTGGPGNLGAFFGYDGTENFHGATTAVEAGSTYIYAVGGGEPCSRRAYAIAKYNTAGAFVAAATDSTVGVGFATCSGPGSGASDTTGIATLNGNVYLAGQSAWPLEGDFTGRPAIWKYDSNLNLQWRRKSATTGGSFQTVAGIQNSLYAVGSATPPGGTVDYLIEKYDEAGNLLWSQTFGGSGSDRLTGVIGVGNRVFAVGWSTSPGLGGADGVVFEIDPNTGNDLTSTLYGGAADDRFNGISTDGTDLYVVGESRSFAAGGNAAGQNDVILVRYAPGAVFDTTAPTVTAHPAPLPNASGWNNEWVMVTLVATDDTGGSGVNEITYSINGGATVPVSGSVAPLPPVVAEGQHTVTFRASDVEGNQSAPGTLTVKIDRTQPTLNLPINVIAEATSLSGTPVNFTWSANDALSGVSTTFIDFQSGSLFQLGTTTVNVTATDLAGNTANGSFTVTVQDTTVPTIQTGIAPPPNAAGWNRTDVTVSFACVDSGSVISSCTPPINVSTEGAGQQVTGIAIDASGNSASKTATVNLDKTAPSLSLPPAIVVEATSAAGAIVNFTATASDSLSGVAATSISQGSGTTFPLGTTVVNFQATDAAGNISNGSFNVVVGPHANDNSYSMAQHGTLTVLAPGVLANDFVRAASSPSVEFVPPPGFGLTNTGEGGFTFASPSDFVGTVQFDYLVHTGDGDSNTGHISVVVTDSTAPVLSLPSNITVYATGGGTTVGYDASATDAIDGPRPVSCTPQPNTNFPIGTTTVNCSASDTHFNTATGSFTVTVHPRVLTSITVAPASANASPGGHAFFTATGHYNDGTSQQLSSGTAGGGPPRWSGHLTPGINLNQCTTAEYPPSTVTGGLSIFGFAEDPATHSIVPTQWSLSTPIVEISGTIDDSVVHVDFACSLSGFSGTASFDGIYDGMQSKYVGTFTGFDGSTGAGALTGWSTKASMPDARFAAGAATVQDVIYVAGGGDGSSFASALNAYHPDPDTWTNLGTLPTPREGVGVAALNGLVYVVGGHEPGGVAGTRVEAYDPVAGSWSTKGPLNTPRAEFSLVVADGSLFALGGQQGSNDPTPITSVERYDPVLDTWTAMTDMPDARSFFAAGALNILGRTTIVAAGGTIGSNVTGLYDVATNTWTAG